jgi:hypothetical protein
MGGKYEEFRRISGRASWSVIIGFCLVILGWGYVNYRLIADAPRQWDLGQLPEAPGQSIYTAAPTPTQYTPPSISPRTLTEPRQVPELPEAHPPRPSALSETQPLVTWPTSAPSGTGVPPVSSFPESAPRVSEETHGQDAHATETHGRDAHATETHVTGGGR